jgi:predicted nucleotidyltransferase
LKLREALPFAVAEIVEAFDPVEVMLFGSVARGEEGPDSDLDLLSRLLLADGDVPSRIATVYAVGQWFGP